MLWLHYLPSLYWQNFQNSGNEIMYTYVTMWHVLGTPFPPLPSERGYLWLTTIDHTHFLSRPHSNANSFLQCNKGLGFPDSFGPTITGWFTLPSNTWGKHLKTSMGKWLTTHSWQRWTMCSHCVTSLGSNWLHWLMHICIINFRLWCHLAQLFFEIGSALAERVGQGKVGECTL